MREVIDSLAHLAVYRPNGRYLSNGITSPFAVD
jgi:hypothetical protein